MEIKKKCAKEYMDYLNKIGRRVGCLSDADHESIKMTASEQLILTSLLIEENVLNFDSIAFPINLTEFLSMNDKEVDKEFIRLMRESFIKHFHRKIEKIYKDLING